MFILGCDRCGVQSEAQKYRYEPSDWHSYNITGGGRENMNIILCPKCATIVSDLSKPVNTDKDLANRVLDILEEIATNVIDNK